MITKIPFGTCTAGDVFKYVIENKNGYSMSVITLGGIIQELFVPVDGGKRDIVLGYDTPSEYYDVNSYYGAIIGRCGNRIGNARFTIGGNTYTLAANNGVNCLHGGIFGFNRRLWNAETNGENTLVLSYLSPDGEEGFPGNLNVKVTYTLDDENKVVIDYEAVSDKDTVCNLTNHSYFTLSGGEDIMDNLLWVNASQFLEADSTVMPTGKVLPVAGTPLDFTAPKALGKDIFDSSLAFANGYDHNFCLDGEGLRKVAQVNGNGITMDVFTDLPGMQLYCAPAKGNVGKGGKVYEGRIFLCLETQGWPDAINRPGFPSVLLKAGDTYKTTTIYAFS